MSVAVAILGLGVLILIHELGHFLVSLALRMRPRRFYLGFPPAILKTRRRGIEYGIGAIPLGGFVKIPGMHRPAPVDVATHFARAEAESRSLRQPLDGLRDALARGEMDRARQLLGAIGEAIRRRPLSAEALEAAEKGLTELDDALGPDAYWRAKTWKRIAVIFAGPAANILLALVLFTALYVIAGGKATTTVDSVAPGSPAAATDLRPRDRILSIDGVRVEPEDISQTISSSEGRPLRLTVTRDDRTVRLEPASARLQDGRYRLGFVLRGEGLGFAESVTESFRITGLVTKEIGASLGRLVAGEGREEISSPVGIVQGSSQAAREGPESYIWVLALISLSIALLNLLPLLPLDGGHIAFAVVEGIRGRSVGREMYERVSIVGIGLVLLLFFVGLSNDINRLS